MNDTNTEEPPIRRFLLQKLGRLNRKGKRLLPAKYFAINGSILGKPIFWAPTLLVAAAVFGNLSESRTHAQTISDLIGLDPKTKLTTMSAIDQYTPFVDETRDADVVVTAEIMPSDLVLTKPGLARTNVRPSEQPKQPEKRTKPVYHTVAAGETLSEIATSYGVRVASIKVDNTTLTNDDHLKVGDQIKIPATDYSDDYLKKNKKVVVAQATTGRKVSVRETSATRYEDSGMPAFARPAGSKGKNGYHSWALDIPPDGGRTIMASADGVVVEVADGWDGGYGRKIVVDHGSGWETLYAHLESISVKAGQKVAQGQAMGVMGATGRTYPIGAVHLHFEIRKNGSRLNPINYVD